MPATLTRPAPSGFAVTDFVRPPDPSSLPYTMPTPSQGQTVLWYPRCAQSALPVPCSVVKVEPRRVFLVSHSAHDIVSQNGVRHCSDPATLKEAEKANGCWAFTQHDIEREAEISRLRAATSAMQANLARVLAELGIEPVVQAEGDARDSEESSPEDIARRQRDLEAALEQPMSAADVEEG